MARKQKKVGKQTAALQFLAEVATFINSPAGEAMANANPKMTLEIIFERARKLQAMK